MLETQTGGVEALRWSPVTPNLGDPVFALGDPGTGLRVTEGRVSADLLRVRGRGGRLVSAIEHTAPMPRGAGGGPLVNAAGELIGINALRGDRGSSSRWRPSPRCAASDRLLRGEPDAARLGVAVAPPRAARRMRRAVGLPDRAGVLVRDVEDGLRGGGRRGARRHLIVAVGLTRRRQHPHGARSTRCSAPRARPWRSIRARSRRASGLEVDRRGRRAQERPAGRAVGGRGTRRLLARASSTSPNVLVPVGRQPAGPRAPWRRPAGSRRRGQRDLLTADGFLLTSATSSPATRPRARRGGVHRRRRDGVLRRRRPTPSPILPCCAATRATSLRPRSATPPSCAPGSWSSRSETRTGSRAR